MLQQIFGLGFALSLLIACHGSNSVDKSPGEQPENFELIDSESERGLQHGQLLSAELITSLSLSELSKQFEGFAEPRNAVHLYRMTYRTIDPDGLNIDASGLIALPADERPVYPMIAIQHGTITSQVEAPSVNPRQGILEASQGFIVALQDYIGFGKSASSSHPYLIPEAYVQSGLDMIRATQQFAAQNQILMPVFFLAGYSEGGYASLAIQQAIETKEELRQEFLGDNFRLLASAPAAGPYSLSLTAVRSLAQERVNPVNILKVIKAYRTWYQDFDADYIRFFKPTSFGVSNNEALQTKIDDELLSGRFRVGQLLAMITSVTSDLVQADYLDFLSSVEFDGLYNALEAERDPTGLLPLLEANNLIINWAPRIPTRLYHCIADEVVPVAVANAAVDVFRANDPDTQISAVVINDPSFGHGNCPAVISPVEWFASFLLNPAQP